MLNLLSTIISTEVRDDGLTLHRDSKRLIHGTNTIRINNHCNSSTNTLPSGLTSLASWARGLLHRTGHSSFHATLHVRLCPMTLLPPALSQLGIICIMDSPHPCRPMSLLVRDLLIRTVNILIFLCCLHCMLLSHETHCQIATIWLMSLLMGSPHSCRPMSQ